MNGKKTELLPIRLSPLEKAQLQALAEKHGMNPSQYIRYTLIYSNDVHDKPNSEDKNEV